MQIKLPERTRSVLEDYLKPKSFGTPDEILLLTHFMFVSRVLCFNRVRIYSEGEYLFPNLYGMCFIGSGRGKDRSVSFLDDLYQDVWARMDDDHEVYYEKAMAAIDEHLLLKEQEAKQDGRKPDTAAQKQRYRDEHSPRRLVETYSQGTQEGLEASRLEYQKAEIGAVHFKNDEFIDYISATDQTRLSFLTHIKGLYEKGDSVAKVTKGDMRPKSVKGVPQTMLVYSSLSGLVEDSVTSTMFQTFLERGLARRSIICCPEDVEGVTHNEEYRSFEEEQEMLKSVLSHKDKLRGYALDVSIHTNRDPGTEATIIELAGDAQRALHAYRKKCRKMAEMYRYRTKDSQISELMDRPRRALRLSACIAVFEHPKSIEITALDFECAVECIEMYSNQFDRVANMKRVLVSERLLEFIIKHQEKKQVTKMDIYRESFAPSDKNKRSGWLKGVLEEAAEIAIERGLVIIETKGQRRTVYYSVVEAPPEYVEVEKGDVIVSFSFTASPKSDPVDGYKTKERPFKNLHNDIMKGYCYSPATFRDGYRDGAHVIAYGNCIMIDIDDGLKLEAVKPLLSGFQALVITTGSHGKEKKGLVADRYRVIIPVGSNIDPKGEYKDMMTEILKFIGVYDHTDLKATRDKSRYYKPSPTDAIHWYSPGTKLLNWKPFDRVKAPQVSIPYVATGTVSSNARPDATFQIKDGSIKTWADFNHLQGQDTLPVRCIFTENHKNGDKNPSAFIGRHTGGNLMFACSACSGRTYEK